MNVATVPEGYTDDCTASSCVDRLTVQENNALEKFLEEKKLFVRERGNLDLATVTPFIGKR